jgi:hypothetical protein
LFFVFFYFGTIEESLPCDELLLEEDPASEDDPDEEEDEDDEDEEDDDEEDDEEEEEEEEGEEEGEEEDESLDDGEDAEPLDSDDDGDDDDESAVADWPRADALLDADPSDEVLLLSATSAAARSLIPTDSWTLRPLSGCVGRALVAPKSSRNTSVCSSPMTDGEVNTMCCTFSLHGGLLWEPA